MLKIITEKRYKELLTAEKRLGGWRPCEGSITVSLDEFLGRSAKHDPRTVSGEIAYLRDKIKELEDEVRRQTDFKYDAKQQVKTLEAKERKRIDDAKKAEQELTTATLKAELDEKAPLGMSFEYLGDIHVIVDRNISKNSYVVTEYTTSTGELIRHKWTVEALLGFFRQHDILDDKDS